MPRKAKQQTSDDYKQKSNEVISSPSPLISTEQIPSKVEKPKRKGRFEAGSQEAKDHMKKLRELKAQKKSVVV